MYYDNIYNYKIITEYNFNEKYLLMKNDGSKYKKYFVIYYKDNDKIKNKQIINENEIKNYKNIISIYEIEEIISSCNYFDSEYKEKLYYKIKDKICFIKYLVNKEYDGIIKNDNKEIKEILENLR